MHIIYRITSIPSTNPSPIFQNEKDKLNEVCLRSLLVAFKDVDYKLTFLADHCSDKCKVVIRETCDKANQEAIFMSGSVGINATMLDSYRIASFLPESEIVLFNECDHLWLPDSGPIMLEAIKTLGLVSGYDHPDFYSRFDIHPKETEVVIVQNHHFRKAARNVMSWGCHSDLVKENLDILNHHGYLDDGIWSDLRERGHQLWTALPALSTHMVKDYMAPGIDWKAHYEI